MTYKSKISCQLVVEVVLSSCLLFFVGFDWGTLVEVVTIKE